MPLLPYRLVKTLVRGLGAGLALGMGVFAPAADVFQPRHADPMREAWRWRSYAELSGLGAQCVVQAPDGTVWFGTNESIWSYDGVAWKDHHTGSFPGAASISATSAAARSST